MTGSTDVTAYVGEWGGETVTIVITEITGIYAISGAGNVYIDPDHHAVTAEDGEDTNGVVLQASLSPSVSPVPEGLLQWSGGSSVQDHPERRKVSKTAARKVEVTCDCGDSSEDITVWVINIDLNLAGVSDDDEDTTPAEVYVNSDDDDDSGTDDRDESPVTGENDLLEFTPEITPEDVPAGTVTVTCSGGIAIYEDSDKGTSSSSPWDLATEELPDTLHIEGRSVSSQPGDRSVEMRYQWSVVDLTDDGLVTVLPREGDSEAYITIFEDAALDNELSSVASEEVYPALFVKIGPGERVKGGTTTVTIRYRDEYEKYFTGTDVDGDVSVDLSSASGWEQQQTDGTWDNASTGPASTDNKDGADDLLFRYKMTWDTRTFPLGNNSPHSILATAQVEFQEWVVGTGWTNDYESGPVARSVTTRNLSISGCTASNGTIDYFKYDPDGDQSLAQPHITFTIDDPSPGSDENQHEYAVTIRYRQTMGDGTWNWDTGGWSWYKKDLGTSLSGDINLTSQAESEDGQYLNGSQHEWGTYTYDFIVMEFEDGVPEDDEQWTQANADDWCFLKRYKDGYHLWVPENLPSPHGDEPGHEVWTDVPENGDAGLRGFYCLESDWSAAQEDEIDRGTDAEIVIVDPELEERSNTSGPAAIETLGAAYGTADADSDGDLDGLPLYTYQASDPAGAWRGIFMANDNGGVHSPKWRTHEPLRMLTANQLRKPAFCALGYGSSTQQQQASTARSAATATEDFRMSTTTEEDERPVMLSLYLDQILFISTHGSGYENEGPNQHDGDRLDLAGSEGVATTTSVAQCWDTNNEGDETYGLIADGTEYVIDGEPDELHEGITWTRKKDKCWILFAAACSSAESKWSFARRAQSGGAVRWALGYNRVMHKDLNATFVNEFWSEFALQDWDRPGWWTKLWNVRQHAVDAFWAEYTPVKAGTFLLLGQCDPTLGEGESFTHLTGEQ